MSLKGTFAKIFRVVAPKRTKLAHGEGRSFILFAQRLFPFVFLATACHTNVTRLFGQPTPSNRKVRFRVAEELKKVKGARQRDNLRTHHVGLRWWTTSLFFRTDPPPTPASRGLMSTARSRSPAMGPSRLRPPRRPTRTPPDKASSPRIASYMFHIYPRTAHRNVEQPDGEERAHCCSLPSSVQVKLKCRFYHGSDTVFVSRGPQFKPISVT